MQDIYVSIQSKDGSYIGNILLSAFVDQEATEAIKEQANRITILEEKLSWLKKEVADLEQRLDDIQYPQLGC